MSCSPFDLKDFFLKELPNAERSQVESHLKACAACREDLDRLQLTEAALFSLRDEEIPQRIAFVSDKIFEPSPARRWLNAFWGSSARLGFASAAMLSCALFFFAVNRTAPAPNRPAVTEKVVAAAAPSPAEIQQQIQKAVAVAVADVEARQAEKTTNWSPTWNTVPMKSAAASSWSPASTNSIANAPCNFQGFRWPGR